MTEADRVRAEEIARTYPGLLQLADCPKCGSPIIKSGPDGFCECGLGKEGFMILRYAHWLQTGPTVPTAEASARPKCIRCSKELSSTLDAYYGKDPMEARRCAKCRRPEEEWETPTC